MDFNITINRIPLSAEVSDESLGSNQKTLAEDSSTLSESLSSEDSGYKDVSDENLLKSRKHDENVISTSTYLVKNDAIDINDLIDSESYHNASFEGNDNLLALSGGGYHQISDDHYGSFPQTECMVFDNECKRIDEEASILIEELVRKTIENEIHLEKAFDNDTTNELNEMNKVEDKTFSFFPYENDPSTFTTMDNNVTGMDYQDAQEESDEDEPIEIGEIKIRRPSESSDNSISNGRIFNSKKTLPPLSTTDVMGIATNVYYTNGSSANEINKNTLNGKLDQQNGLEDIIDESYLVSYGVSSDQPAKCSFRNIADNGNADLEDSLTDDFVNISTDEGGMVINVSGVNARPDGVDVPGINVRPDGINVPGIDVCPDAINVPVVNIRPVAINTPRVNVCQNGINVPGVYVRPNNILVQEDIFPQVYLDKSEAQMSVSELDDVFDAIDELQDGDSEATSSTSEEHETFITTPPSATSEIVVLFPSKRLRVRSETEIHIPFKGEKKIRTLSASTFELLAQHYLTHGRFVSGVMSLNKNDDETDGNIQNTKEWCYILRNCEQSKEKQWKYNVLVDGKPCQLSFQVIEDPTAIERWETSTFELMNTTAAASSKVNPLLRDSDWVLINCSNRDIEMFTAYQNELIESCQQSMKVDEKREDELAGKSCAVS